MSYGIKFKNPMASPLRVEILHDGKIIKTVAVGANFNSVVDLDEPGDYEVKTFLMDPDDANRILGEGSFEVIDHQDVEPLKAKHVSLSAVENLSDRRWRTVVRKVVSKGSIFRILTIEVQNLSTVQYRLKIGETTTAIEGIVTFDDLILTGGQTFSLQAQSRQGIAATASARVSGEVTVVHTPIGDQVPKALLIDQEPEEEPVRSLADRMKELEKQEVLS
jgi:hypothetical protein